MARKMYRSPGGPPRMPASPSPASRIRVPSSTPAGMLTDKLRSRLTRPAPLQAEQGLSMVSPRPWQVGQVRSMAKKPCCARTRPWPPQVAQVFGFDLGLAPVPEQASQVTEVGTFRLAVLPENASSSVISML